MIVTTLRRAVTLTALSAALAVSASAQIGTGTAADGKNVARLEATPKTLTAEVGHAVKVSVKAYDAAGKEVPALIRLAAPRRSATVDRDAITPITAGSFDVVAVVIAEPGALPRPISVAIPVRATWPPVRTIEIVAEPGRLFAGVTLSHTAIAKDASGRVRTGVTARWSSSNAAVASVDRFGNVTARTAGAVTISAQIEDAVGTHRYAIAASPVARIDVRTPEQTVMTGEVVKLDAVAVDAAGRPVPNATVHWSFMYASDDTIKAQGAAADIREGRFVAEFAGLYTLVATSGQASARRTVDVRPRDVVQTFEVKGRGNINHVHTSDLWTFEGKDKRDYAIVGTWGGDGWAYMFDITDPSNLAKTDSVKADARIINDVTVSPDARYAVMSREGASNRVNGLVVLDIANPAHPKVVANFDEDLSGGVHNMFATERYLYALSGGDKYIIIDMQDITKPKKVGEYNHPNSSIHDLWVHNGIAYSSEWGTGVVVVDVGNGKYGGTAEKPVLINTFPTTSGATHEVFPYFQKSTGRVYIFLGDEIMSRRGRAWAGTNYSLFDKGGVPQTLAGYTHIVDFTDPKNPVNIARYEQPEFGTHDIIVENDILYQAYYDGGVRVVDVSGELMGNLARQQREIAVFKPFDPQGYTPNAPMVMNTMPHKGHIFFTDFNSGLWAAKLQPRVVVP